MSNTIIPMATKKAWYELHKQGQTYQQIANDYNTSVGSISGGITKYKAHPTFKTEQLRIKNLRQQLFGDFQ